MLHKMMLQLTSASRVDLQKTINILLPRQGKGVSLNEEWTKSIERRIRR